ncbi:hypothetical protein CEXT_721831 [Caerostris extrusa]|uniref:Uncharacterized protein n=1 Tax=Caerostris extrusa TaxID=172846 RepID=A0AAV4VWF4_CAEEX|nr:hypothetical protein CEXT_721831 [Caerostris extrusa]
MNDNFVTEITPYLRRFANISKKIKDSIEQKLDLRKKYADDKNRSVTRCASSDKVWVNSHTVSNKKENGKVRLTRHDGSFIIMTSAAAKEL